MTEHYNIEETTMDNNTSVLTPELLKRGLALAESERLTRWGWGDWAVDVAPVGEQGQSNGARARLAVALEELVGKGGSSLSDLPSPTTLRNYREAASAIPPELRHVVRSIDVGRKLSQYFPDLRERHRVIAEIANDNDVVTERALREYLGHKSKDGQVAKERDLLAEDRDVLIEQVDALTVRIRELEAAALPDPELTAEELAGGELPDFAAGWADKLVVRLSQNTDALTHLIETEGLRFAPTTPLVEMHERLLIAERRIADVRAAVGERMRDAEQTEQEAERHA